MVYDTDHGWKLLRRIKSQHQAQLFDSPTAPDRGCADWRTMRKRQKSTIVSVVSWIGVRTICAPLLFDSTSFVRTNLELSKFVERLVRNATRGAPFGVPGPATGQQSGHRCSVIQVTYAMHIMHLKSRFDMYALCNSCADDAAQAGLCTCT